MVVFHRTPTFIFTKTRKAYVRLLNKFKLNLWEMPPQCAYPPAPSPESSVRPLPHQILFFLAIWNVYPMLRTSASGPGIGLPGRISAEFEWGKPQNRPSGKPEAGSRCWGCPS